MKVVGALGFAAFVLWFPHISNWWLLLILIAVDIEK